MHDYKKLVVWKKSFALAIEVYKITSAFPKEELFGLVSQIRRASVSIPANIAEGCGRDSDSELVRFLIISQGSATELDTHLLLARELDFCSISLYNDLVARLEEVRKMLTSLIKKIKNTKS